MHGAANPARRRRGRRRWENGVTFDAPSGLIPSRAESPYAISCQIERECQIVVRGAGEPEAAKARGRGSYRRAAVDSLARQGNPRDSVVRAAYGEI